MKPLAISLSMMASLIMTVRAEKGHDAALRMASIIKHSVDDKGIHHYQIPVAYKDAEERSFRYVTEYNKDILKVEHLNKKDGFRFATTRELTSAELFGVYEDRASGMGDVPSWAELVLLSKEKAKEFPSKDYTVSVVAKVDIETALKNYKVAISGFTPIKRNCSDLELAMTENGDRTLVVNSRAAMCIGHDHYSIRIINKKGEIVWQDLESLGGDVQFLCINTDEDDVNEVLFYQDDHGAESLVILDPKH